MRTVLIPVAATLAACGPQTSGGPGAVSSGTVAVVAAENFWGSIVAQLGGSHAHVTSLITNPDTDPHSYEPTTQDARAVAEARYLVVNGAGYDAWADKLAGADPSDQRTQLTVATLAHRKEGDNPHMWYDPGIVMQVVQRVSADLQRIDPADAAYFAQRENDFTTTALGRYDRLRSSIRTRFAGVPVAATESIFQDLAADLRLHLLTPPSYMRAVAEGDDPSTADKAAVDAEVQQRQVRVLVFNAQNSTPAIQALVDAARNRQIPVVGITETLDPASATFQDWQCAELAALQTALESAA